MTTGGLSGGWWNGILTTENERRLAELRKEMDSAHMAVTCIQMTNVARATPSDMVKIDLALRDANHRFWRAFHAYQAAMQSTPS